MKTTLFAFLILFVGFTSCGKFKEKRDTHTYYCEDYKDRDMNILGVHTSEISAMWVEFCQKDGDRYCLVVKDNNDCTRESGECTFNGESSISFVPDGGSLYTCNWEKYKYTFIRSVDLGDRVEDLTFILKENKCKKK